MDYEVIRGKNSGGGDVVFCARGTSLHTTLIESIK